ncbi:MAG TPA: hypothetical protein PLQ76_04535, partial [bacterium]|nr:hypothetical protein [bacterium]
DRKIDVLRELMRQADSKIESLGRAGVSSPREIGFGDQAPERQRARNGAEGRREPAAQSQNEDDRRSRIVALRRRGLSSAQIAKEVEMGRGEVDLILNIEGLG